MVKETITEIKERIFKEKEKSKNDQISIRWNNDVRNALRKAGYKVKGKE